MNSARTTEGSRSHPPAKRIFVPSDFEDILRQVPESCPLVGGQAVAWWALHYRTTDQPLTSCDIDFWGYREDLQQLAAALHCSPILPHGYEMTAWVGGIPLRLKGEKTLIEFINTVPGLDVINPEKASVGQVFRLGSTRRSLLVLSPVSLVLAKLHALRAYDQTQRQDELHLKVSLVTSKAFISQLLDETQAKQALWNVERLIAASRIKAFQRLETKHDLSILSAVPIRAIEVAIESTKLPDADRQRLKQFLTQRWPRIAGRPEPD